MPVTQDKGGADAGPEVEVRRSRRRRRTVSAYRDTDGRIVVLMPARMSRAEEREWVDTMVARLRRSEAAPQAERRGAAEPGAAAVGEVPRGTRPARVGALGRQPAHPVGLVHPARPHDPALHAAAGDAGLGGRLRAGPRARAPARGRAHRGVLAHGRPLPQGRAGQGLPRGRRVGSGVWRRRPRTGADALRRPCDELAQRRLLRRQVVDRPPAHVVRLLGDRARVSAGSATATNRTSRWSPPSPQNGTACRSSCTGDGSSE